MPFVDLQIASTRSGLTIRHLRGLCAELYGPRGQARLRNTDGKPHWEIDETADPRFARVKSPENLPADLRDCREADRQSAFARLELLNRCEAFVAERLREGVGRAEAMKFFSKQNRNSQIKPSTTTLYRWQRRYRTAGLEGLLPQYIERETDGLSDEAVQLFRALYLDPRRPSIKGCHEQTLYMAKQHDWGWFRSLRACQRWVRSAFSKPELVLNREGQKAYNAECAPYLTRDPEQFAGNECWVGDHHQFDLWCLYQGKLIRPWLTAWQDMRSRVLTGWCLSAQPNQSTIMLAFRAGAATYGLPSQTLIDNGRDYGAYTFHGSTKPERKRRVLRAGYLDEGFVEGVFGQLGIAVTFAIPYNPQSKPVERTFRTIDDQFCRTFSTYCANSPQNRREDIQAVLAKTADIPTFDDVRTKFTEYVQTVYHATGHQGAGMEGRPPLEVLNETRVAKRVADERLLDLLLCVWSQPIIVGKHGVRFRNLNYGAALPELVALQGRRVRVAYDPDDVSAITVWDLDMRFVCRAQAVTGTLTDEQLREGMRTKRHIQKSLRQADDVRHLVGRDVADLAIAARAQAARDRFGELPDPGEPAILTAVQTGLEGHLERALSRMARTGTDDLEGETRLLDSLAGKRGEDGRDDDIENRLLKFVPGEDADKP